ncbi:MAG: hypothetical protein R2798_10870 [Chitinophagales bacterium]|nr:hypothetical protein [Chitinophagales bacterium]
MERSGAISKAGNYFIDGSVEAQYLLAKEMSKTSEAFQLVSRGRPGELLINGK